MYSINMSLTPKDEFICPITMEVMGNAVVDTLGVSYDEAAILHWLRTGHHRSPVNQQPLCEDDLRPNLALRSQIERYNRQLNGELDESDEDEPMQDWSFNELDATLNVTCERTQSHALFSINPSTGTTRTPLDICCVVDVSGSMDDEATVKGADGKTESHGLSILDVVKHALKTIIMGLSDNDRFSLVKYSDSASVVLGLTVMDTGGKSNANASVESLCVEGRTNLWDGIEKGLNVIRASNTNKNSALFVLTDGLPNLSPSRGELHALQRYKEKHGDIPCSIDTFGFGFSLDSKLLQSLANEGHGSFAFIPDSGLVGTIFVNAMSNQLTTAATNLKMAVEFYNGEFDESDTSYTIYNCNKVADEFIFDCGSIQFGQSKDLVLPTRLSDENLKMDVSIQYNVPGSTQIKTVMNSHDVPISTSVKLLNHSLRQTIVSHIKTSIDTVGFDTHTNGYGSYGSNDVNESNLSTAKAIINSLSHPQLTSEYAIDLMKDYTGQVKEALSTSDSYKRWGIHYLLSLSSAHLNQKRNNFKDPGVQHYGGALFEELVDVLDDVFNKLPPPKSTRRSNVSRYGGYGGSGGSSAGRVNTSVASMSTYNTRSDPCFHGDCIVTSIDGLPILMKDLKKGDEIISAPGMPFDVVKCVIKTKCKNGKSELVTFASGLKITSWHPIAHGSQWVFPSDVGTPFDEQCDYVYNVIMEKRQPINVNGVKCCTLGHNIKGNVIGHEYFGTDKVVEDFSKLSGWKNGFIELDEDLFVRSSSTNLVVGIATCSN